jgi:outer membrane receptor protein involved in Fe transport
MKKHLFFIVAGFFSMTCCFGQGTVRGKVTDNTGETLIGAVIKLKSNPTTGTLTDLDGLYSLKINDSTPQILVITYVSYKDQEATVNPKNGEVILKDFVLSNETAGDTIETVEITAKATKSNNYYMENLKINSSQTMDYISQETMKKTGDANVANAVARVPGVSSSSNAGFITVRGIGDRYVKTTLNGSRIPTLDPYTNNIRLDLFPASLVDNIILTKTASPDLPGDFAGAYLSIETKDYPDKLSVNVESQVGYNTQSTFKDVVSSQHSSTEWLGFDKDLRNHDHYENGGAPFANLSPTPYQNFVALGLGDYYHSIGVTASTPWNTTYFNLGLVHLGLLNSSQMDDANAVAAATAAYNSGSYQQQAFNTINAPAVAEGQSFKPMWNTTTRKAPINFTQSFSIGNQIKLFGRPFGFLAGFRYSTGTQYDPNSTVNRVNFDQTYETRIIQQATQETNNWSALFNIAYKYSKNHSITLLFMPNFTGTNNVRSSLDASDATNYVITKSQFYEQRRQLVSQLKSEHYIPAIKMKIELNGSYTDGKSAAPDFKDLQYWKDPVTNQYQIGGIIGNGVHRYYRYLSDNLIDSRLSAEMPISNSEVGIRKIKIGGAYQYNWRKNDQYDYNVNFGPSAPVLKNEDLNAYFNLNSFGIQNQSINFYYNESGSAANHTFGNSSILAGFVMTDYTIIKKLRISGGIRIEKANVFTDVFKFDSLGYKDDDLRRSYSSTYPLINPGRLNNVTLLPSASVIYKLKDKVGETLNLRANFSQTVARPSIRELSDVALFDYQLRAFIYGNSKLKPVQVKNYDLRGEWYFKNKDNVSLSVFYKDFRNNIEIVNSGAYTWQNTDKSYVAGIEVEGKKSITRFVDVMVNGTFVKSETTYPRTRTEITGGVIKYITLDTITRPNFGQAPYIINTIVSYKSGEELGLTAAVSYNIQGRRLAIASAIKEIPDVYEMPRNMIDIKVSKTWGKHWSTSLTAKDILNTAIRRAYIYSDGHTVDYDKFRYGRLFQLSVAYKL